MVYIVYIQFEHFQKNVIQLIDSKSSFANI